MQKKSLILALTLVTLLVAGLASGAGTNPNHIASLAVQVSSGGHSLGTFSIKPAKPITVKAGVTYTLTLVGTTYTAGKPTTVPVNATFKIQSGGGRIVLSHPGSNSVDVTVVKKTKFAQIKYTVASGIDIFRGLKNGYITLI